MHLPGVTPFHTNLLSVMVRISKIKCFGTEGIWLQMSMLGQDVYEDNSLLSAISYHFLDDNCFLHAEKNEHRISEY